MCSILVAIYDPTRARGWVGGWGDYDEGTLPSISSVSSLEVLFPARFWPFTLLTTTNGIRSVNRQQGWYFNTATAAAAAAARLYGLRLPLAV